MASLSPLWVKITDFGIAKSWAGTALRSNSGTNVYKAPERLGLLSAQTTTYTSSVDMWAFGAIIYQILTSEIPFADRGGFSGYFSGDQESCLDDKLLKQYCDGLVPFPIASLALQGAGANAIDFVKSLMLPDPSKRPSAEDALKSVWFDEIVSSATSNQDAAIPSGSQIPFSAAQPTVDGLRATKLGAYEQIVFRDQAALQPRRPQLIPAQLTPDVTSYNTRYSTRDVTYITLSSPQIPTTYNALPFSQNQQPYPLPPFSPNRRHHGARPRAQLHRYNDWRSIGNLETLNPIVIL